MMKLQKLFCCQIIQSPYKRQKRKSAELEHQTSSYRAYKKYNGIESYMLFMLGIMINNKLLQSRVRNESETGMCKKNSVKQAFKLNSHMNTQKNG
jgi:hypothetical protein